MPSIKDLPTKTIRALIRDLVNVANGIQNDKERQAFIANSLQNLTELNMEYSTRKD